MDISAQDRAALLREGIAVIETELTEDRLKVEVTGAPETRVREAVIARLGEDTHVTVVDDLPCRLYARPCSGYMEREEGRLQLRYAVWPGEHMGDVFVVEDADSVVVLGMACVPAAWDVGQPYDAPVHVYLERPLGERTVVDGFSGEDVPYNNVYAEIEERMANGG